MYKINFFQFADSFAMPKIVINNIATVDALYLKIALTICQNAQKNYSTTLLSSLLNVPIECIEAGINYWIDIGLLQKDDDIKLSDTVHTVAKVLQPTYSVNHAELQYLLESCENLFARPITSVEQKSIIHILEFIKLPADVLLMVIEYCASISKINARYIEKVAVDWANKGIVTHELAEQYLQISKEQYCEQSKIKKLLGIDRALLDSEAEHINRWIGEFSYTQKEIKLAYEKTIAAIGKLAFPYMNKILENWYNSGYKTIDDILENDIKTKKVTKNSSYDIDELSKFIENKVPKI